MMKIQSILLICLLINQSFAVQPTRLLQTDTDGLTVAAAEESYQNSLNSAQQYQENSGVTLGTLEDKAQEESNNTKIAFAINYVKLGDEVTFTFDTQTRLPPNSYWWFADSVLVTPMRIISPEVFNIFKQSINLMTQNGATCENPLRNWLDQKPIDQTTQMLETNPQTFDPMTAVDLAVPEATSEMSQMLEDSQASLFTEQNNTMTQVDSTIASQNQNIDIQMDAYSQLAYSLLNNTDLMNSTKANSVTQYQALFTETENQALNYDTQQLPSASNDLNKIDESQGQSPIINSIQQLNLDDATISNQLETQKSTLNQDDGNNGNTYVDTVNQINQQAVNMVTEFNYTQKDLEMIPAQNENVQNLLDSQTMMASNLDILSQANMLLGSGGQSVDYDMLSKIQSATPLDEATRSSLMGQLRSAIPDNSQTAVIATSLLTPGYTYKITCNAYDQMGNIIAKQPFMFTVVNTVPLKIVMIEDDGQKAQVTMSANCANQCDTVTINWKNVSNLFEGSTVQSTSLSVGPLLTLESDNDCLNKQVWSTTFTPTAGATSADILIDDANVVGTEFYVFRLSVLLNEFPDSEFVLLKLLAVQQNADNLSKCTSNKRLLQTNSLQALLAQQQTMQSSSASYSNPKLSFNGSQGFEEQSLNNQNFVKSPDAGLGYSSPTDFLAATQGDSLISYLSKNPNYMEAISLCKSSDIYTSPFLQYKAFDESTQLIFINARQGAASSNQFGCGPNGDCFAYGTCKSVPNALRKETKSCECIEGRAGKFCQYTSEQALAMQNQQSELISNVASAFGIDLGGSIDDDIPLISDPLAGSQLVLGMVQSSELTKEQLSQVVLLVNALVSGPNEFISNDQFTIFKGALGGLITQVAGDSMMTKAQRRNQLSDSKLDQVKDKYVTKSVVMASKTNLNFLDTSLGNEVGSLSIANEQTSKFTLATSITDQNGNVFQAPQVEGLMIDGAAYTNLVGSGCADSVINCNLDQAVISMDVLDEDGKKMDVSSTSMLIMIPLNGDSTDTSTFNCQYWDTDNDELSTEGLTTSFQGNFAVCKTTHLTSFTAGSYNADESFVGEDENSAYKSFTGIFVLISCIIIML